MKKIFLVCVCLALATAILLSLCSCSVTLSVNARELSRGYTRKTMERGDLSDDFKNGAENFSFELLKNVIEKRAEKSNSLISPLSALLCLGLIANGSGNNTLSQLEAAFGCDIDTLNKGLYAYTEKLSSDKNVKIGVANSVWMKDDDALTVKEDYLQKLADWYDSETFKTPFDSSAVRDINGWCSNKTDGMIDRIIDEIDSDALIFLINALVFEAKWEKEYEKSDILDDYFHGANGERTKVKMLSSKEGRYLSSDGCYGMAKPYKGQNYCFVGLLPEDEKADIFEFAASLTGEKWAEMWKNMSFETVNTKIPEFKNSDSINLNEALEAMGITDMFDTRADFENMGNYSGQPLCVDSAKQKTFIEVDRSGTKAAAITWGEMKNAGAAPSEPKCVILDRPFVYMIVDTENGLPLFIGIAESV